MQYSIIKSSVRRTRKRLINGVLALALTSSSLILGGGGLAALAFGTAHAQSYTYQSNCAFTKTVDSGHTTWTLIRDCPSTGLIDIPANTTLDGNGFTLTPKFAYTSNSNNAALGIDNKTNVTIKNLTIDGTNGTKLHGVNVYESTNVALTDVTLKNNGHDGLVVNSSDVTVNNLTTANNGWGGVDVDQQTSQPASLTITGTSSHTEPVFAVYVDNDTKNATVHDLLGQYTWARSGLPGRTHDRVYSLSASQTQNTVTVTGNTSSAENSPGWMFNRDSTSPYEFTNGAQSTGIGSLFVKPISSTASDKFAGELFFSNQIITQTQHISYDFKVSSGGDTAYKQFYANVYANYSTSASNHFYDCRYNVIPTSGTVGTFSTVTFDPSQNYQVDTHYGSALCPAAPVDMGPGATIRAITINVGDTSASDVGVSGYLDNVVVASSSNVKAYDFEPVAPVAPAGLAFTNPAVACGGYTNILATTAAWNSVPAAASYNYRVWTNAPGSVYNSETTAYTATGISGTSRDGTFNQGNGTYSFEVQTLGTNGLVSPWSAPCSVTYDTTAPVIKVTKPTSNTSSSTKVYVSNSGNLVVSGTAIDSLSGISYNQLTLVISDYSVSPHTAPVVTYPVVQPDGTWSVTIAPHTLIDGHDFVISASARDGATNVGSDHVYFSVDNTRPTITFNTPTSFAKPFKTGPALAITATAGNASGIATTVLHVYHSDGTTALFCPVSNTNTTTCDTSGFASGDYYVKAGATDNAGNNQTITQAFTIDSLRPTATITAPSNGASLASGSFTIIGSATDGETSIDHVNVYVTKLKADGTFNGYAVNNQPATFDSSTGTFSYNVSGLAEGKYNVKANAFDAAGNSHFASGSPTFTVDTTKPTLTIDSYSGTNTAPTLTGTTTDASDVVIVDTDTTTPAVVLGAPNSAGTYNWSYTLPTQSIGSHTITVTSSDLAGNTQSQNATVTVVGPVEISSPTVTPSDLASPRSGQPGNRPTTSVTPTPTVTITPQTQNTPQVLGDSTTTPSTVQTEDPQVKGASTTTPSTNKPTKELVANASVHNKAFLGLGWWWLVVLAAILGFLFFVLGRTRDNDTAR